MNGPRRRRAAVIGLAALALAGAAAVPPAADGRRSGFDDMSPETQAMQRDDGLNPGMLWVSDGAALWDRPPGAGARSCAECHGAAAAAMRGVAARYPAYEPTLERPVNLSQRINICRARHQQALPLASESQDLLALESYVAHQSRGLPVAPDDDPRLAPFLERGQARFRERIGQLDLACTQCHDERAGRRLGGSVIPQAHATGYPVYRLEWQAMGSLQRRLRNCMIGVRAEPFGYGAPELIELELHLATRDRGMPIETPAVRP